MDIQALNLLQSCVRQGASESDLGYLTKWLMVDYNNITLADFINKINEMLDVKFFDNNKKIKQIVESYSNKPLNI